MDNNLKVQLDGHRFFLGYKLDYTIHFYNESKHLVRSEIGHINKKSEGNIPEEHRRTLLGRKDEYLGWFHEMLIRNCFLMIHSHLEEALATLLLPLGAGRTACKDSGITRFKEPFEKHQIRICEAPKWSFLMNCSKVRHLILHANGNVSLAKDPNGERKTCRRLGANVKIRKSQIVLQEGILQEFAGAVAETTDWILQEIAKVKA